MVDIKKLIRSSNNKVFSGVLGGIGEFFNINPTFLRIIYFILVVNSFFTMIIIYIVFSLIIPLENDIIDGETNYNKVNNNYFLGIALILLGIILLANNILPIYFPNILSTIKYYISKLIDFWPAIFIVSGIYLLMDTNK